MKLNLGKKLRLSDAIAKAGGFLLDADTDYVAIHLNLASVLSDGSKVFIPLKGSQVKQGVDNAVSSIAGVGTGDVTGKVNVNTATQAELESLAGIGVARAVAIIANRPYSSKEEISSKAGIPLSIITSIQESIIW